VAIAFSMSVVESANQVSGDIATGLLHWYDDHARTLPWRAPPGQQIASAYRVWLSEIMLQQTTVAAVIPYYKHFTVRWPDVSALAAADDADLMAAWAGLGYYARARNLLKCARMVVDEHGGEFPSTEAGLIKLPGIGAYTAAAIAAIAYDERAIVVDANVERVISRLFAIETPLPAAKAEIRTACDTITPAQRPGDFAQAMMDLGATICSLRNPTCPACPLAYHCTGYKAGIAERLPVKPAKTAKPQRIGTAYWIEKDDHVWLIQREGKGMLAGMRALPDDRWAARRDGDSQPPIAANWRKIDEAVDHVFTHFTLSLNIAVTAEPIAQDALPPGIWWPIKKLDSAGLPTLFMKAAKAALQQRERL
jgi:A/G-specific adenine glycosylase